MVLALEKKTIPPNINFRVPNPNSENDIREDFLEMLTANKLI